MVKQAGVSVLKMDEGIDSGEVLAEALSQSKKMIQSEIFKKSK